MVEFVEGFDNVLRLKSSYAKYLTASEVELIIGFTGLKVVQSMPQMLDSSIEWELIRDRFQVRLKARYENYLRANARLPPWRSSFTHDIPYRHHDWILWDVEFVEAKPEEPSPSSPLSETINPNLNSSSFSLRSSIYGPTEESIEWQAFSIPVSVATQTTPIVAWLQQQWRVPTPLQETQQQPQCAAEIDEDREEKGGGYEIVANKISSVATV
ncbi:unnamed protein product [Lactuca virosa]|uniref:DUF569 domain-containing protein n=1 Tax=Lactuca virosa TaxID=75947 RepID=A0AAU9PG85_9ASTR|nr:unnamed protein product [Lactuca virosa]